MGFLLWIFALLFKYLITTPRVEAISAPPPTLEVLPLLPQKLFNICTAESGFRQFKANGTVLRGRVNPQDIGICQINLDVWGGKAKELGYNIFTDRGNRLMALWIYHNYGSAPWYLSEFMWSRL